MSKRINEIGAKFGKLTVIGIGVKTSKGTGWLCRCECGVEKSYMGHSLRSGKSKSCGCVRVIHNESKSIEHKLWSGIIWRCTKHKHYIQRGITVCDRWASSFQNFLDDMGRRPSPAHSIDRIDNDGPYSPENCRWATIETQNRNKSSNVYVDIDGDKWLLKDVAKHLGVKYTAMLYRYHAGWSVERMVGAK